LVTPLGVGAESTWKALVSGKSGAGPITLFEADESYPSRIACEVRGFDASAFIEPRLLKTVDRFVQFGLVAAQLALDDAGLTIAAAEADRVGVYVSSGFGGIATLEHACRVLSDRGPRRVSPYFVPGVLINLVASQIAIRCGARGSTFSPVSACASGAHALGEAFLALQRGSADVIIAGASEAAITPLGIAGFGAMKALSTRNDAPERASRPFDRFRDGFVMAEGAGLLVLEEWQRATRRGARIYAELVGYGSTGDAYHVAALDPEGSGIRAAMRQALVSAQISPDQVGHLSAHGTSTRQNDSIEAAAIHAVFGDVTRQLLVSAPKSMTGHLLGAAGSVETAFCAQSLAVGLVPPTINLDEPDADCQFSFVTDEARQCHLDYAMNNSFGFGGTNVSLVLRRA
jgi:3-oxoacyl-[acyl-carrier-protein] synthase II